MDIIQITLGLLAGSLFAVMMYGLWYIFLRNDTKPKTIMMDSPIMNIKVPAENWDALRTYYISQVGNLFAEINYTREYELKGFLEAMDEYFDTMEPLYRKYNKEDKRDGRVIIKAVKGSDVVMLELLFKTAKLSDYGLKDDTEIKVVTTTYLIYPQSEDVKASIIENLMDKNLLTLKEESNLNIPVIYTIGQGLGGYRLIKTDASSFEKQFSEPDLNYEPVEVSIGQNVYQLDIDKFIPFALLTVAQNESIGLTGVPGTGKTRLLQYLAAKLGYNANTKVLIVDGASLSEIQSAQFSNFLASSVFDKTDNIVLLIDQAEVAITKNAPFVPTMLNIMGGITSFSGKTKGVTVIYAFNGPVEKMDPRIFRGERSILSRLFPLSAARAKKKVTALRATDTYHFDSNSFNRILRQVNKLQDNSIYAKANEIVIADLYTCFKDKDRASLLALKQHLNTNNRKKK